MRCGELAALTVSDFEDDGDVGFLKVRHGKGAKFRRLPLASRLRRELGRYINRHRIDAESDRLLLRTDGEPVRINPAAHIAGRVAAWIRATFESVNAANSRGGLGERMKIPNAVAHVRPAAANNSAPKACVLCGTNASEDSTSTPSSSKTLCAARAGSHGYCRIRWILIDIATKSKPHSAAEAPTSATKKSCHCPIANIVMPARRSRRPADR